VTTRAAEAAELPERVGARVILAWPAQHHDEQAVLMWDCSPHQFRFLRRNQR
jgi:hypothetical protein